jgi:hypothetical protein
LGQKLTVQVSHSVLTLIKYKENYWLTNTWMVKYQSMLCRNPQVWLNVVKTLNLATLLWVNSGPTGAWLFRDYGWGVSTQTSLTNDPISHPNIEYFMDGNSFVWKDTCFARYAVVTLDAVIKKHNHCQLGLLTHEKKC